MHGGDLNAHAGREILHGQAADITEKIVGDLDATTIMVLCCSTTTSVQGMYLWNWAVKQIERSGLAAS